MVRDRHVHASDATPAIRTLLAVEDIVRDWEGGRPSTAYSLADFVHGIATIIEGDPQAFWQLGKTRGAPAHGVRASAKRAYESAQMLAIMEAGTECGESYERLLWQISGYFGPSEREIERRLAEVRHARKTDAAN